MFISELKLNELKNKITNGDSNIERIILHEKNSQNIQLMCIAFKENNRYPPIADKEKGNITFVVLEGKLRINTFNVSDKKIIDSKVICQKEIYKIPRYIYRETISISDSLSIFLEIIEGPYNPENRILMN
tara:strand:+ start:291 stop:680 length:390 start_codon:yes stop_codon:yes gene_type:complete